MQPETPESAGTIRLAPGLALPASLLQWSFSRSGGPGGQNVNKLATRVQLRVALADLAGLLPAEAMERLRLAGRSWITDAGDLLLTCDETRSQMTNRGICQERLVRLLRQALRRPRVRRATAPTRSSRRRRLEGKRQRAWIKAQRRGPGPSDAGNG